MKEKKIITREGNGFLEEKKSKFIAVARPVKTEEEARAFVEEIKKKYRDARHNVFAFQVGEQNEIQRYSDDGEPQGTAGLPVLGVITGEGISDCCIVVTRYFGGTLLGTGGLVRAYGRAAKEALLDAGIGVVNRYVAVSVETDYTMQGKLSYEITKGEYLLEDTIFTDQVEFRLLCAEEEVENFCKTMQNLTNGQAQISTQPPVEGVFVDGKLQVLE